LLDTVAPAVIGHRRPHICGLVQSDGLPDAAVDLIYALELWFVMPPAYPAFADPGWRPHSSQRIWRMPFFIDFFQS
jgi:hypothetical protein